MSPFFRAARTARWTVGDVATIVDDDVDHFMSYLLATYNWRKFWGDVHDAICASKAHPAEGGDAPEKGRQAREETFETLIGAYVVADKYGDIYRANQMIDQTIRFSRATTLLPHLKAINQAYDPTLNDNPLRALLRDLFIHEACPEALERIVRHDDVHLDFAADVSAEWCKLKFDHMNGHINKWFKQEVSNRPQGHYHQELHELTTQARGVILTGTYHEILKVVDTTRMDEDDGEPGFSDKEGISKASRALLQAVGECYKNEKYGGSEIASVTASCIASF